VPTNRSDISQQIAAARAASEAKNAAKARSQREVASASREITPADIESALRVPSPGGEGRGEGEQFSPDEIANLFEAEATCSETEQTEPQF
jgi:hypothetical protein